VQAFAYDPNDRRGAYALLTTNEIYHTRDRGQSWDRLPFPPPGRVMEKTGQDPKSTIMQAEILVSEYYPGLLIVRAGNALYRSDDSGQTWRELIDGVTAWTAQVDSEMIDLYAWQPELPGKERGLYRSRDGGEFWQLAYAGYFPPLLQSEASQPEGEGILSLAADPGWIDYIYAGTNHGIFLSKNGGGTWQEFNTALPSSQGEARRTPLLVTGGPSLIYALTETTKGNGTKEFHLMRLEHDYIQADQDYWQEVGKVDLTSHLSGQEAGFHGIFTLVVAPDNKDELYLGTQKGALMSQDGGETWEPVGTIEASAVYRLTVAPGVESQLYLWTSQGLASAFVPSRSMARPDLVPTMPSIKMETTLEVVGQAGGALTAKAIAGDLGYLAIGPRLVIIDLSNPSTPEMLGQSDLLPGLVDAILLLDHYAYLFINQAGLAILDVSEPKQPILINSLPLPNEVSEVYRREHLIYLAERDCSQNPCSGALRILSVADPVQPQELGKLITKDPVDRIEFSGELAVLVEKACLGQTCEGGLRIVEAANPASPHEIAYLEMPERVITIEIANNYAYVAHARGISVVDLTDLSKPRQTGTLPINYVNEAVFGDGFAYLISGGYDLKLFDMTDPTRPRETKTWSFELGFSGSPFDLYILDDTMYIMDVFGEFGYCWSYLNVYDISDPEEPLQLNDEENTLGFTCAGQMELIGSRMYVEDWAGLRVVDISQPDEPRDLGKIPVVGSFYSLAADKGYVYGANPQASGSLHAIKWRDPRNPAVIGPLESSWSVGSVLSGDYLYVPAWANGLRILDVSEPSDPREVATLDESQLDGYANSLVGEDNYLYVLVSEQGMRVVDVSNPRKPKPLGTFNPSTAGSYVNIEKISVAQGAIYLATYPGSGDQQDARLIVVDAGDPESPKQVHASTLPKGVSVSNLLAVDEYLYLVSRQRIDAAESLPQYMSTLSLYDISDPAQPQVISALEFPERLNGLALYDRQTLLLGGPAGVFSVNISDPTNPHLSGQLDLPGGAGDIAVDGEAIYVNAGAGGVFRLRLQETP
jgi:photosystem II stability/assembly factor-like uncharacterized protein